ncbi:MAG TPA: O-antigen ligase family protein, partial [Candidatus Limnocylindria bacterium]|nr:O-antigen ligase family protein [Candidatus Limnocylindria bacterium]
ALVTLLDPSVTPRFFPEQLNLGPIGASEPLLAIAGLVVAVNALRRGTFADGLRGPTFLLALLFVAVAVVSALVNATPALVAGLGIFMTLDAMAIFFVWRMLPMRIGDAAWAIGAIVAAGVAAALFGIGQVMLDPNLLGFYSFAGRFGEGARITSFLGNPNMLSPVIGFTLPFALFGTVRLERRRDRWLAAAVAFVLVLALVLTFSRGAWAAVGLGLVLGTLLLDRRALLVLVLLVPLAWATAVVMPRDMLATPGPDTPPPVVPDWIGSTVDRFDDLGGGDLRIRFLTDGLRIIDDNLLLGVGPGRYGGAAATILGSPVYAEYDTGLFGFRTVHDFWLHLTGEVGVIGVAVFLTMVMALLIRFVRAARRAQGLGFIILAGAATATLVVGFNNLTEMLFEGNVPAILIWLILAVGSLLAPSPRLWGPIDDGYPRDA